MKKLHRVIILFIVLIAVVILPLNRVAFGAQEFKFTDGTLIRGELQEERIHIKTKFGDLYPKVSELVFVSSGKIELSDGSQVMGKLLSTPPIDDNEENKPETLASDHEEGLLFKAKYGTFELFFSMEDIEYIDFKK